MKSIYSLIKLCKRKLFTSLRFRISQPLLITRKFLENRKTRYGVGSFAKDILRNREHASDKWSPYTFFLDIMGETESPSTSDPKNEKTQIQVALVFFVSHFLSAYVSNSSLRTIVFDFDERTIERIQTLLAIYLPAQQEHKMSFEKVSKQTSNCQKQSSVASKSESCDACNWHIVKNDTAAVFLSNNLVTKKQWVCLIKKFIASKNARYLVVFDLPNYSFVNWSRILKYKRVRIKLKGGLGCVDVFEKRKQHVFDNPKEVMTKQDPYVSGYRSTHFEGAKQLKSAVRSFIPAFNYNSHFLSASGRHKIQKIHMTGLSDDGAELFSISNVLLRGNGVVESSDVRSSKQRISWSNHAKELFGRHVLLPTQNTHHSHFLAETLSNLFLIKNAGDIKFVAFDILSASQRAYLTYIGLNVNDIVFLKYEDSVQVEELLFFGGRYGYRPESLMFFRENSNQLKGKKEFTVSGERERVYISRTDSTKYRNLVNEIELIKIFEKFDFEVIEASKIDVENKVSIFSQARVVSGPLGAGLHPIVFSSEQQIIALTSNEYVPSEFFRMWGQLSCKVDLVIGKSLYGLDPWRGSHCSYYIEPKLLRGVLSSLEL